MLTFLNLEEKPSSVLIIQMVAASDRLSGIVLVETSPAVCLLVLVGCQLRGVADGSVTYCCLTLSLSPLSADFINTAPSR